MDRWRDYWLSRGGRLHARWRVCCGSGLRTRRRSHCLRDRERFIERATRRFPNGLDPPRALAMRTTARFSSFLSLALLVCCNSDEAAVSSDSVAADARQTEETPDAGAATDAAPDVDFSTADRSAVLDALNFDCLFQSCDGDFNWNAVDFTCSTNEFSCSVVLWTTPHDFVGSFDEAKTEAAMGSTYEGDDGRGAFRGSYEDHFEDEDGRVLESLCSLAGYQSTSDLLDADGDITNRLHIHLLDCIFAVEAPMFELLADK